MKDIPQAQQALKDARRELATAYAAFFAGANIHSDVVAAERHFITEWVHYYDPKYKVFSNMKPPECP